ncbi:DUF488 domain-containing protein [Nocardioides xinjiangensis]|uniref:DUF488 domain-containing protein n=1 Tax=Nocardioides xinjiangensis TaxID=2817376 RepID=UPI001B30BDAE|nr:MULTISPECIES: DUF488 domain-containing protein [unclassified Nocardioides]
MGRLLTVGHGTLDRHALAELLTGAGADLLVDVRRFPNSRHNPDVSGEAMAAWLPQAGIGHRWDERLGGRRRVPRGGEDADGWWRVEAFRAYAAHTRTPEFRAALQDLARDVEAQDTTVVMCSESVWWRCHRRLVADAAALLAGLDVAHLAHTGRTTPHEPSAGARVVDGLLRYDADADG